VSVSNLFAPGGLGWRPDANAINAPDGVLLRADNLVPDEDGALSVRRGTRELYNFPDGTEEIRSLHTVELADGYTYRMMQADDQVYVDPHPGNHTAHWEIRHAEADDLEVLMQFNYTGGNWEKDYASTGDVGPVVYTATWESAYASVLVSPLEPVNFNVDFAGTGDIAFGDDHSQVFMARATTRKKFDGKSFLEWSIAKPSAAATLTSVAPTSTAIISFASGETGITYWPTVLSPPRVSWVMLYAFEPDENGTASQATRLWPGRSWDTNLAEVTKTFSPGSELDLSGYDGDIFDIAVNLEDPKHVKYIELSFVNSGVGEASYKFYPKSAITVPVRDVKSESALTYDTKVTTTLDPVAPKDKPRITTAASVQQILGTVGASAQVPQTGASEPPPGQWVHLSVTKAQFDIIRGSAALWDSVDIVRLRYVMDDGFAANATFSDLVMYSAGEGTLTGTYRVVYRWVRETDRYYETSPPSDESEDIYLFANQLRVTIPGAAQNAADDQTTTAWVYLFGGYLDQYYRVEVDTADPQKSADLVIDVGKNEVQILTENEKLEPYHGTARDNIVAIAGPWNSRLFTLTAEGYVYPSMMTSPSSFNTYQVIDLSNQGDPLWMVKTSSGIHVGSEKDVVFLAGSGDEDTNRTVIDLYPHPLNIGTPPADTAVFVDGNSILYRSTDGLVMLASQGLTHVPDDGIRLLWRGQDRHGVSALNTTGGRFRLTVDGKIMYCLVAEGDTTEGSAVVYRLDMGKGQWSRLVYPDSLLSIITEPNGTLTAGTTNGKLLELEYGTGDTSEDPAVLVLTPFMAGQNPLVRKDAFDLQFHTDTNGDTATVQVYKDGATTATASYTFSTSQPQAYRIQAEDVGAFIRAQLRLTGDFSEFQLSSMNLTYRVRTQHMTYLDTGYIVADDPADVVWLQELEIDANSPSDLEALVYLDDRLYTTQSVPVSSNVRTVYRVPLPRGTKSRRPRIVIRTSAADGAGEIGFDPYMVRIRTRNSGNQSSLRYRQVWPAGTAP
jgi:hypothetical protein